MKNDTLGVHNFQGGGKSLINFAGFTNITKAMTETQFEALKKSGKYEIYHKDGMFRYLKDLGSKLDEMDENVEKAGEFSREEVIDMVKGELATLSIFTVVKADGKTERIYMRKKSEEEIKKALDNIAYSAALKFFKTGKEIKEKLVGILATVEDKKEDTKTSLDDLDDELSIKPHIKLDTWEDPDGKCPYKTYGWNQTYFNENNNKMSDTFDGQSILPAASEEEAKNFRKWNELVRLYCRACCDVKKVKTLSENLEEEKKYELSLKDLQELGF